MAFWGTLLYKKNQEFFARWAKNAKSDWVKIGFMPAELLIDWSIIELIKITLPSIIILKEI